MRSFLNYFTTFEKVLWLTSVSIIIVTSLIFDNGGYLTLFASLLGVTSLIFYAKGNPAGPVMMIIFCLIYGYISFEFTYYGELITYVGMTLPMTILTLVSWLRNPYNGNKSQVEINDGLTRNSVIVIAVLTVAVTIVFYFILKYFNTANLIPSTASVATSFIAAALTFVRSPYYALGYASNDLILVILWTLASFTDISYISVTVCFAIFFVNDSYGFINWKRMEKLQSGN